MEVCAGFELIAIENAAALGHDSLELSKRPEVLVRERLIQDGPEVFSRLKLGGVAGQVDQPEALGHNQVRCGGPAGVVENEHDDPLAPRGASGSSCSFSTTPAGPPHRTWLCPRASGWSTCPATPPSFSRLNTSGPSWMSRSRTSTSGRLLSSSKS